MRWRLALMYLFCGSMWANAGVRDCLIYERSNRYKLNDLDAVVEIKVNHYFAFSDPYTLTHFIKERNKFYESAVTGIVQRVKMSKYWNSAPEANAMLLLRLHSVWVVDAVVTNVLMGECAEKNICILMKKAPGYFEGESPRNLLRGENDYERRVLGLVKINKDEVLREFRHMRCYLEDCQDIYYKKKPLPELYEQDAYKVFQTTCSFSEEVEYYVMREVGFEKEPSAKLIGLGVKMKKSTFIQKVEKRVSPVI